MAYIELFGNCEICGAPATHLVRDIANIVRPEQPWIEKRPDGDVHRFCEEHKRDSVVKTVYEPAIEYRKLRAD